MRKLAIVAFCFLSSLASATEIEEIVVKARRIEIILTELSENHKQDSKTGDWYYVEEKKEKEENRKS